MPKIITLGAALEHLGASTTFTTRVGITAEVQSDEVLRGALIITGGGDPPFGTSQHVSEFYEGADNSAEITKVLSPAGISRLECQLVMDGSLFGIEPQRPSGWMAALTFDRLRHTEPLPVGAEAMAKLLAAKGTSIKGGIRTGATEPPGTVDIAVLESSSVRDFAIRAGHQSDNFVSEVLTKQISAEASRTSTGSMTEGSALIVQPRCQDGANVDLLIGSGQNKSVGGGQLATWEHRVQLCRPSLPTTATRQHPAQGSRGMPLPRCTGWDPQNQDAQHGEKRQSARTTWDTYNLQESPTGFRGGVFPWAHSSPAFALTLDKADSRCVARSSLDRATEAIAKYSDEASP